jgi:hypothetical protein
MRGERSPGRAVHLATVHCDDDELDRLLSVALAAMEPAVPARRSLPGRTVLAPPDRSDGVTLVTVGEDTDRASGDGASDPLFGDLPRHQIIAMLPSTGPTADTRALLDRLRRLVSPFTTAERLRIARLNPIVAETVRRYRSAGADLSRVTVVFRDHLLLEKLNALDGLVALGLPPAACLVVGKPDSTVYRHRVVADLARSGFVVSEAVDTGFFVHDWLSGLPAERPVVLVDDGGDLALEVLRRGGPDRRICPIETTTKGIRVLRSAGLLDRVVNLSDTSTKDAMNRRIAVSCVYRFREIMRHEAIESQGCVVVGYGRLGRGVASLLAGLGMTIRVVETDSDARREACRAGFATFTAPAAATADGRCRFLFGCSGQPAVTIDTVLAMGPNPVLASVSSQDLVPVLHYLRRNAIACPVRDVGVRYELSGSSTTVLADGHAVNLYQAEGVSEPDYDPFTALMLTSIVEGSQSLERGGPVGEPRPDPERWCRRIARVQLELGLTGP